MSGASVPTRCVTDLDPHNTAAEYLIRLAMHREQFAAQEASYILAAHRVGLDPTTIARLSDTSVDRIRSIIAASGIER